MSGKLQSEIQQTRPFQTSAEEAFLNLARTADRLAGAEADVLKAADLSAAQYNILRILRGAGPAGHTCSGIGGRMITRDPDVTRLLDRLEARGLVMRSRSDQDRRVVTTRITPEGVRLLRTLDRPVGDLHRRLLGRMKAERLKLLIELLEEVRELCE